MKSTDRILALRYARAYSALSTSAAAAVAACEQLAQASQALAQAQAYMQSPVVSLADKKEWVHTLFGTYPQVSQFIGVLLEAKRYYLLEACVHELRRLTDQRQAIVRAQVETASALSERQKKQVELSLGNLTGKTVQATFTVRPELLGGLRARFEDKLLDGTLQGRFVKLQEELIK